MRVAALCLIAAGFMTWTALPAEPPIPRKVMVLFDSTYDKEIKFLSIHQIAEMPLNHLGLITDYHDINAGLPSLEQLAGVRGVLTWFRSDTMSDPEGFLRWAASLVDAGKKLVIVGDLSANRDRSGREVPLSLINPVWAKLGLRSENNWVGTTYDWTILKKDSEMVEFERPLGGVLAGFPKMKRIDPALVSYLTVRRGQDASTDTPLVTVNRNGGYVASNYMHFADLDSHNRLWYINPFEFFRQAFGTDDLPKPDTTTLGGRRIFYSHIDGDGWRNVTEVPPYKADRQLSPYVILKEVVEAFPDLPVTIAPIAADIDPNWHGSAESLGLARQLLVLPNVEAGSHTYAHPLEWGSFENYGRSEEAPAGATGIFSYVTAFFRIRREPETNETPARQSRYARPISYDDKPFDLNREISGSAQFINSILPEGKKVEVLQWSGNALPFEEAIAASRAAGLRNLNGGDSRFDPEYHSYGWVSSIGREVGGQLQIYASNSNENTYTDLWSDRFFGFKYLIRTVESTETPLRIKPHNIYFHMYSGEKLPSLLAVVENFKYARSQPLAPITAGHYAAIADSFFTTELEPLGAERWRVRGRGDLQTIRFDNAALKAVDFLKSEGVLGQIHYQGSLYVALDPAVREPVLSMRSANSPGEADAAPVPYLVGSRWEIEGLRLAADGFTFSAHGFGPGDAQWRVPGSSGYIVNVSEASGSTRESFVKADEDGRVIMNLGPPGGPVQVRVRKFTGAEAAK